MYDNPEDLLCFFYTFLLTFVFMFTSALIIAKNWPEPNSTAAGRRTLDLLHILSKAGYDIHVASPADETPFQADLENLGFKTHRIAVNDSSADEFFSSLNPQLVVFDRFIMEEQFGWRIKNTCPDTVTILDTSDLHCLRFAREQRVKTGKPLDLLNDVALREISAILRCDLTLMISQIEVNLLKTLFSIPDALLFYLPFLTHPEDIQFGLPRNQRKHLITMGGLKHEPNRDAVRWLKSELWPLIKQSLPKEIELHVVGAYADHAMNQLNNPKERFFIKGRVDDALATYSQYRVNLAPLRFGAGQKGKVLEGWLTNTPTISTPIGIESMAEESQLGFTPTENAKAFAKMAAQAYLDDRFAEQLTQSGRDILLASFQYDHFVPCLKKRLRQLSDETAEHRHQNFYGRLLWQQQFRATEFMSRWIELKNKV